MPLSSLAFLALTLPAGSELYLSEGAIYAEKDKVDVTLTFFEEALARQAIEEFQGTLDDPSTARAGVVVSHVKTAELAGRPATEVLYSKPAMVAQLNDAGEVEIVKGQETTVQTYIDLGETRLVLTVWTKREDADLAGLSGEITATLVETETVGDVTLGRITIDGRDVGEIADFPSDPLETPLVVEILRGE